MRANVISGVLLLLVISVVAVRAKDKANSIHATVVYEDAATQISAARVDSGQLWITTGDLTRATRFEVKPQGVCRDELCFPLPVARKREFENKSAGKIWFNLTAFAHLVDQPVAHDDALAMWFFGLRADQRQTLSQLQAPDFTLPDVNGKPHSLSDFRGKKVLLITWASW